MCVYGWCELCGCGCVVVVCVGEWVVVGVVVVGVVVYGVWFVGDWYYVCVDYDGWYVFCWW